MKPGVDNLFKMAIMIVRLSWLLKKTLRYSKFFLQSSMLPFHISENIFESEYKRLEGNKDSKSDHK